MNNLNLNDPETKKRLLKYIVFSLLIALALRYLPNQILSNNDVIKISTVGSVIFAVLDMYSPAINLNV
jgi:hypothetical protein